VTAELSGSSAPIPDTILSSFFGADGRAIFLATHWPERHFCIHGPVARLPALLKGPELKSLDALAQRYTGTVAFGRGSTETRTISADTHAGHLFKLGFTVYLSDIAALLPGGKAWLAALEHELGVAAGCSKIGAFASPRGDGLPVHFDVEDVISLQLIGSKTFEVAKVDDLAFPVGRQFGPNMLPTEELYPQVPRGFPRPEGLKFERLRMEPGSVLYMPRGTWHSSRAESDSFSVSVGLRPPAALDYLLHQLRFLLLQDPEWRRPLYGVAYPDARRSAALRRLEAVLNTLPGALAPLSADDIAPPVAPNAHLESEDHARFQKVPMSEMLVDPANGRLHLTLRVWDHDWIERTTLQTEVPISIGEALEWLKQRSSAFDTAEIRQRFPALPDADLRQLLALLSRSGYLRRLRFPLLTVTTL
jgi:hypothetical protein